MSFAACKLGLCMVESSKLMATLSKVGYFSYEKFLWIVLKIDYLAQCAECKNATNWEKAKIQNTLVGNYEDSCQHQNTYNVSGASVM